MSFGAEAAHTVVYRIHIQRLASTKLSSFQQFPRFSASRTSHSIWCQRSWSKTNWVWGRGSSVVWWRQEAKLSHQNIHYAIAATSYKPGSCAKPMIIKWISGHGNFLPEQAGCQQHYEYVAVTVVLQKHSTWSIAEIYFYLYHVLSVSLFGLKACSEPWREVFML